MIYEVCGGSDLFPNRPDLPGLRNGRSCLVVVAVVIVGAVIVVIVVAIVRFVYVVVAIIPAVV